MPLPLQPVTENAAEALGLLAEEESEALLLVQMPNVLPMSAPGLGLGADADARARAGGAAGRKAGGGADGLAGAMAGCSLKDFPSGKVRVCGGGGGRGARDSTGWGVCD